MTLVTRSSDAGPPPLILAVIDNPDVCEGFAQLLTPKGYEVASVRDGRTCLERIQQDAFSALLLHACLPDQYGLDLLTAIRAIQPQCPIIVTTTRESCPDALQQGAFAVLVLPYRREDLVDILQRAISSHRSSHLTPR